MATTTYGTPYVQSSDLVSSYPGTSSTLATRVDDVSLKGNGLNNQTGTSYTLVLTDGGKTVTLTNAAAVTVTIPTNASVAFPVGTMIRFCNLGAGTVTIQPTGGVTLNGGNQSLRQYAAVQLVKLATDTWGLAESAAGKFLQIVSACKTDQFTTTSTGYVDVTGLSVAITPSSTASKIYVACTIGLAGNTDAASMSLYQLYRDSTAIAAGSTGTAMTSGLFAANGSTGHGAALSFLDSPSSTSALTYKIAMRVNGGTGVINRLALNTNWTSVSTITAMEVTA